MELRGKLFILLNDANKALEEFRNYRDLIENLADTRTKMLFYKTYSDAYIILKHFSKAFEYCNLAKSLATKLGLREEMKSIDRKLETIVKSMHEH